jgi:hypothetical protein
MPNGVNSSIPFNCCKQMITDDNSNKIFSNSHYYLMKAKDGMNFHKSPKLLPLKGKNVSHSLLITI